MRTTAQILVSGIMSTALLAAAFLPSPAAAQVGGYVGFGTGQADNGLYDKTDRGLKVFGGWQFSPNIAAEIAYVDLGSYGVPGQKAYDHYGVSAQFVGILPLGASGVSLFGKAGAFYWYGYTKGQYDAYGYYYTQAAKDTGTDLALGAGLQFDFHRHMAVRAEWERFNDVAGGDIKLMSASFLYRF